MTLTIEVRYITANNRISQKRSFVLRGKKPEQVAFEFWQQLRTEMPYHADLEKVIANGDQDLTEVVKELESQELRKIDENWFLPF
ncbi:hypothetical protein BIV60_15115 [Bacillus sp. MUM 116]|uniref:hypothetical protein n=1 Tax=Bacillus sp. MUM 116 TaxID=1678002 RepID=UPI0008F5BE76|nr:hypothetical protein [Bacillus sp. MUM 116]OIK13005.1 hypothetical protein BIV60_15115 [Bacillus sp. MUM 116]